MFSDHIASSGGIETFPSNLRDSIGIFEIARRGLPLSNHKLSFNIATINTSRKMCNIIPLPNELALKSHKNIESILSDNCLLSGQQTNLIAGDSG